MKTRKEGKYSGKYFRDTKQKRAAWFYTLNWENNLTVQIHLIKDPYTTVRRSDKHYFKFESTDVEDGLLPLLCYAFLLWLCIMRSSYKDGHLIFKYY